MLDEKHTKESTVNKKLLVVGVVILVMLVVFMGWHKVREPCCEPECIARQQKKQLDEVAEAREAFNKALKARGIESPKEKLKAYGDVASCAASPAIDLDADSPCLEYSKDELLVFRLQSTLIEREAARRRACAGQQQ